MRPWFAIAAVTVSGTASAQTPTAASVAADVATAYAGVTTLEADFEQQHDSKAFGQKTTLRGHVSFAAAGGMRWDYTTPAGDVVATDGTTLYSYNAASNVAYKMAPRKSLMPVALAFVSGALTRHFDLTLLDPAQMKFASGYVLKAKPKVATNAYNFALFYVTQSFQVVRVLVVDANDNRDRFELTKVTANGPIAPALFQWQPPPGTKVITL